jgi:hypothetical protein
VWGLCSLAPESQLPSTTVYYRAEYKREVAGSVAFAGMGHPILSDVLSDGISEARE